MLNKERKFNYLKRKKVQNKNDEVASKILTIILIIIISFSSSIRQVDLLQKKMSFFFNSNTVPVMVKSHKCEAINM